MLPRLFLALLLSAGCGGKGKLVELGVPEPPSANACDERLSLVLAVSSKLVGRTLFVEVVLDGGSVLPYEVQVDDGGDRGRVELDVRLGEQPPEGVTVPVEITAWVEDGPVDTLSLEVALDAAPRINADADGDGFGGPAGLSCGVAVENDADCDDSDPNINPGAPETVADGVDQDCDGLDDCYVDVDADTYGDESGVIQASASCADVGVSASMDDCNDGVAGELGGGIGAG